jgi:hypothetical protein
MNWQGRLVTQISTYASIIKTNFGLSFSDEEAVTFYLFGIIDKKRELKAIHDYANRHCIVPTLRRGNDTML